MSDPVLTFFMSLRSQPAWLALSRQERADHIAGHVRPAFARHPAVKVRWYDAEAFTGRCTDMAVFETTDLRAYCFLIDALRDDALLGLPYFQVLDIVPAVEGGYEAYDALMGVN
ncbi:MAG TPA: darcynin family protein [Phenylobacterium sp.]|nr:darcynin family protein [Phenylobacterium sp.]